MKYKYTGDNDTFCLELIAYGIQKKGDYLQNGDIVEVPDTNTTLINALNASGTFTPIKTTVNKPKKGEKSK